MFSINVEEVFQISNRKGLTLIGASSGIIRIGDYLIDMNDSTKQYKVIGVEMVHFSNIEKELTHNTAIIIESENYEHKEFKGKVFESK